jgi:hypothetical protein
MIKWIRPEVDLELTRRHATESGFSGRLLADVRMEPASKLAKGPFDLVLRRAAFQPQDLVVVFVFHGISHSRNAAVLRAPA